MSSPLSHSGMVPTTPSDETDASGVVSNIRLAREGCGVLSLVGGVIMNVPDPIVILVVTAEDLDGQSTNIGELPGTVTDAALGIPTW